jgi:hypothetical protein
LGNRFGKAYGLTLLSPIRPGDDSSGLSHDAAIREELRLLDVHENSPFARIPTTHLARWVVIDDAPYEGTPAPLDRLASKYLLFTSNFDGDLYPYLDLLRTAMPKALEAIYRHCWSWPGVADRTQFVEYMRACQVTTSFFFGAYPEATANDVLRALNSQRQVAAFIEKQQSAGWPAEELKQSFIRLASSLRESATPTPGRI